jgi:dipeptidase E
LPPARVFGQVRRVIYLGGGGSEHDEVRLWDEVFVPGQRLTVWPDAVPRSRWAAVERWLIEALTPRGDFTIEVSGSLASGGRAPDVLVIPGGNTFDLLAARREALSELPAFLARGGRVYGGSAGAILLGADIAIAGILDPDDAALTDTRGADLLSGHVVYPHFTADQEATARRWAATRAVPVLAIPEVAGVVVAGGLAHNTGPDPVHVFTPDAVERHEPGATWPLTGAPKRGD